MASEKEFETRLTAVEQEVQLARSDAAAARVLARCADRDVETINNRLAAQKALIEAVRETQIEHGQILREHSRRFGVIDARFDGVDARFGGLETEMREGFTRQAVGQAQITALLTTIIDKDR
ncbi:hypothetical protein KIPE111705_03060 [Kibdelosporangium persicum]|uniref:hypothetical protein n=1 Tax=Kibdelosporangium persicum TaxID=2698649 RepID=UPI0015635E79|nr:hypothetical protein [Kibdelosporangium persicum]